MNDMDKQYHWFNSILAFILTIKSGAFFCLQLLRLKRGCLARGMRLVKRHVKRAICKGIAMRKLVKYQIDPLEYAARVAAGKGKE